ncbi:DUF6416 domain-containing protein [Gandjariella thermophila]|uniref:Uncharacterized protein n=1 Tax=Gandjariella thermophila TaxID=1931992 RepID=A0A4D4JHG2_9PSEU|nr:DUF6416 domain-containing protein [Gandjariella thermophila]GDY33343.1 hypothetical protein GTS_49760 [Gandjariella thermophila]
MLNDEDPLWERHSGREGHSEPPEWDPRTDLALAETYYRSVDGKGKVFLDLLIDRPGRQLSVDELCQLAPDTFTGASSVAGALSGIHRAHRASGRRYPWRPSSVWCRESSDSTTTAC